MPENNTKECNGRNRHPSLGSSSGSHVPSSESSDVTPEPPPDGGWGWVVVFASFTIHLIADGCAFSFGVFYVQLLEAFGESKGKTALVGSLFVAVPLMTGPVASALTNRYGCRATTIVGGLIAGSGFITSSYANSLEALFVTFGIVAGLGLSMVYVPAVVIVAYYFEKKRAFATGIAVAGSGIGTFIFAPLTEYLIDAYTWRGCVLIIGGIMFNIVACGALFRPLNERCILRKTKYRSPPNERAGRDTSKACNGLVLNGGRPETELVKGDNSTSGIVIYLKEPMTQSLVQFPTYLERERSTSLLQTGTYKVFDRTNLQAVAELPLVKPENLLPEYDLTHSSTSGMQNEQIPQNGQCQSETDKEDSDEDKPVKSLKEIEVWTKQIKCRQKRSRPVEHFQSMLRKDIFYRGSLCSPDLLLKRSASCPDIFMHVYDDDSDSIEDTGHKLKVLALLKISKEVKHIMRAMLDVAILRNILFVYFTISCFLLYVGYDVPYVYAPDAAIELGISETKASFLLSIIGITSTFGQIGIGYIGDLPNVNALLLYNILTSVAGIVTVLVPLLTSYALLCAFCAAYGFFISGNYALTTIILVKLLGMDKLTNAYGVVMLAEGIANLIGPPLAGWLSDVTGSYDATFYAAGCIIAVSGLMLFAVPSLQNIYDRTHQVTPYSSTTQAQIVITQDTPCQDSESTPMSSSEPETLVVDQLETVV